MPEHQTIQVQGMEELNARLAKLSLLAESDLLKSACRKGADLVAGEAKKLAPRRTGKLEKAIRVRMGKSGKGSVSVLAAVGKKWFAGDEFYGAFQEFGWKAGKRGGSTKQTYTRGGKARTRKVKTKDDRKQIPGEHFMQNAFEERSKEALDAMLGEITAGLDRQGA